MLDPGGILGAIVARKRIDVAARLAGVTIDDLRARATPTKRSLKAVLARPGARFVMEVKRASPSQGALRGAVDPAAIARAYRGSADAISVLTDTPYFGGSFDDLAVVRAAFDGPILAKDFMIDPRQVAEARLHGADAILVMLSVLGDADAVAMIGEAKRLGMDALVEAHSDAEVLRAVAIGAELIGINNRDLTTLNVDLAVTERLAKLVPADRLLVAESGIESRADVERLSAHADAFLVGSSLMRAPDPAAAARALAFGRIKICGLTDPDDLALAHDLGAAYAGLIMVPGTPRAVDAKTASRLAETAADQIPLIGVFRDAAPAMVAERAHALGLHAVQLHGGEDQAYLTALHPQLRPGSEIWAASAVGDDAIAHRAGADRTLFDTAVGGVSGGTGRAFDWARIAGRPELGRALLAGGINPANVRAASRLGAFALDVGSGVETTPGRKDETRLRALFDAARVPCRGENQC